RPSKFGLEVIKLASRDNAKRVLGSFFPSLSSPTASTATAESSHSSSPVSSRPPSFAAGSTDPTSLYWRRSPLNSTGLDGPAMPEPITPGPISAQQVDTRPASIKRDASSFAE